MGFRKRTDFYDLPKYRCTLTFHTDWKPTCVKTRLANALSASLMDFFHVSVESLSKIPQEQGGNTTE